jgi:uncharacterized protein (DUF1499 family)
MMSALRFNETPDIARWTLRMALFSVSLVMVALGAHRFGPMPTLTAFNLVLVAFLGALLALALGGISSVVIWRQGCAGALRVTIGGIMAVGLIGWPLAFWPAYRNLPALNDISTDAQSPPKFVELAKLRGAGSNTSLYPVAFAKRQAEAYPDLKPMFIDRPAEETFEIAREAVFRQKMTIVREQSAENVVGKSGVIEAVDRTAIFGLYDDISVRVDGDGTRSRIDLRSASRFGRHDLGRNAERMRRLMREIVARLEATIPSASGESYVKWRKRGPRVVVKHALDAAKAKGKSSAAKDKDEKLRRDGSPVKRSRSQE